MSGAASSLRNERLYILATNRLWRALSAEMCAGATGPANMARFVFLKPACGSYAARRAASPSTSAWPWHQRRPARSHDPPTVAGSSQSVKPTTPAPNRQSRSPATATGDAGGER
jgi:hypothetical protein